MGIPCLEVLSSMMDDDLRGTSRRRITGQNAVVLTKVDEVETVHWDKRSWKKICSIPCKLLPCLP